ncbi:hypothetical protein GCK72_004777 [Caenorhabditis remanei]|uniref:Uncharacterized protein n=1 Tax=Caenorhabditis remanei TaxID=31234 RepID=A0A6A5HCC5_CAERE|nr:hypothetical protein GCK72_004777 [Caenorhabditis remanei]KAF1764827.1 hypothetical protein GCK72_004777 [Caenorhabditis remanei]
MNDELLEWVYPGSAYLIYTVLTLSFMSVFREVLINKLFGPEVVIMSYEIFGSVMFCMCLFGEAVIFEYYGYIPMLFVTICHNLLVGMLNMLACDRHYAVLAELKNEGNAINKRTKQGRMALRVIGAVASTFITHIMKMMVVERCLSFEFTTQEAAAYPYTDYLVFIVLFEFSFALVLRLAWTWLPDSGIQVFLPIVYAMIFKSGQRVGKYPMVHPILTLLGVTRNARFDTDCLIHTIILFAGWACGYLLRCEPTTPRRHHPNRRALNMLSTP